MNDLVPVGDIDRMAQAIAASGLFGLRTPQQALALMLIAQANGQHPAAAARDYDVVQNRPAKKAEAMLRDFLAAGGKVQWHALDDAQADATFSHPAGGTVRIAWDHARAKKAGLDGKDNWKKYPRAMLRSRVVSEGVRTVYPAATGGLYVPEEAAEFDEAKHIPKHMGQVVEVEQPPPDTPASPPIGGPMTPEREAEWIALTREQTTINDVLRVRQQARADCEARGSREAYMRILAASKEHAAALAAANAKPEAAQAIRDAAASVGVDVKPLPANQPAGDWVDEFVAEESK